MARFYRLISGDGHLEIPCDWWTPRVAEKKRKILAQNLIDFLRLDAVAQTPAL
jgi:hypothetical protein